MIRAGLVAAAVLAQRPTLVAVEGGPGPEHGVYAGTFTVDGTRVNIPPTPL